MAFPYQLKIAWSQSSIARTFKTIRTKRLQKIRSSWNNHEELDFEEDLITIFHKLAPTPKGAELIDDDTWRDLNIEELYKLLNRNLSLPGQQLLYHKLRAPLPSQDSCRASRNLYRIFAQNSDLREKVQLELMNLQKPNCAFLPHLLFEKLEESNKKLLLFTTSSLTLIFTSIGAWYFSWLWFLFLLILGFNFFINQKFSGKIYGESISIAHLKSLTSVAINIGNLKFPEQQKLFTQFKRIKRDLKKIHKKLKGANSDPGNLNEIMVGIKEFSNQFLLMGLIQFHKNASLINRQQKTIEECYRIVGEIDNAISCASFIKAAKNQCTPTFVKEKEKLQFVKVTHPLIPNCIPNSLMDLEKSMLITGSNMSGKTTFLRAIGLNMILGKSLYICTAEAALIPPLHIKTMLNRSDDPTTGKSYFFAEVDRIKEFTDKQDDHIFLIDEIFKGTNTLERVGAATAVLRYLEKKHKVIATTHDIELKETLAPLYKMSHFSEVIVDESYTFDYKLREGSCKSGNAIKLLQFSGYPEEVVQEAMNITLSQREEAKNF